MIFLTKNDLFGEEPATFLQADNAMWMHSGHVDEPTVNQQLATYTPQLDVLETVPGTLNHQWLRFTRHEPGSGCDATYCDCEADDDPAYLWWDAAQPGDEGALPVTVVLIRSREPENCRA